MQISCTMNLSLLSIFVPILLQGLFHRGVNAGGRNDPKKQFVQDMMEKIDKLADTFSGAPREKKSKMFLELERNLLTVAVQSFGKDGAKYVELIMQGVKSKAHNDRLNHLKTKIPPSAALDKHNNEEHTLKEHIIKKITDKIEGYAKKYLLTLRSVEDKRVFLDNVRKKMLEIARKKHMKMLNGDIISYDNTITNSINEILVRNLEHCSRKTFNISGSNAHSNGSFELVYNKTDNMPSETEYINYNEDCIVSTASVCLDVKNLNKTTCTDEDKVIYVANICDGRVDCSNGSDEANCSEKAIETLIHAKNFLIEINSTLEQNCLLRKFNETVNRQNILNDFIQAQIDIINNQQNNFKHKNYTEKIELLLRNVSDTLNNVTLKANKDICAKQEQFMGMIENARRVNQILDTDLIEVLRESALFPKSCICSNDRCVSPTCVQSCQNACSLKYLLSRWSCPAVNGSESISLNELCDGKFDCFDESDEYGCSKGNGRGKFEANEAFVQITKILEMKLASKENEHIRNNLLRLYISVIKLQNLISVSKPNIKDVQLMRDRCFALLSLIYSNYMTHTYNSNDADKTYKFLNSINKILVAALKNSHTGNTKIITAYDCICKRDKCIKSYCSPRCMRACSVESKLVRYYCNDSPENNSVPVEAICNKKTDCPNGNDEMDCSADICRRHHLYSLRINIQDVGKEHEGTVLGDLLKYWRVKATSMLLLAENIGRPKAQFIRRMVKDLLQDLVYTYASVETVKKKAAHVSLKVFGEVSKKVIETLKTCGK